MKKIKEFFLYIAISISIGFTITFLSLGGTSRLNPKRFDWIFGDNTTAYIAQLFYLSDKWRFPLAANPNYGLENSSSIFYTGPSMPIILLQKLFRMNPELQFYGIWFWIVFSLQIYFALKIAKEFELTWQTAIPFSLLTVTPFLLERFQLHFWLSAHFLILWAILIGIRYFKTKKLQTFNTLLLISFAYLINGYLFAMVLIIITFIFLDYYLHKKKSKIYLIKHVISIAVFGTANVVLFDGFKRQTSAFESFKMNFPGPHYGGFPYNLLSVINPEVGLIPYSFTTNTEFTTTNFSSSKISLGTTEGAYDGFLYLGLGIIFLVITLIITARINHTRVLAIEDKITKRIFWSLTSLLFLFAVTFNIGFGSAELRIPFPYLGKWALSIFRASGRFMWVIAYLIIIFTVIKLSTFMKKRRFVTVIWVALILQCMDMSNPIYERYVALRDERVPVLQFIGKDYDQFKNISAGKTKVVSYPPGHGSPNWARLNYWAWKNGMRTNTLLTARINQDLLKRETAKTFNTFCNGNLATKSIFVLNKEYLKIFNGCNLHKYHYSIINNQFFYWIPN